MGGVGGDVGKCVGVSGEVRKDLRNCDVRDVPNCDVRDVPNCDVRDVNDVRNVNDLRNCDVRDVPNGVDRNMGHR